MKLLAAVLCLFLLVGCAEKQEEPTTPTEESGQSLHVSGHPLETQTSGIMEVFPIEETDPQGLRSLGTDVILWGESGISLYTGSGLRKAARASGRSWVRRKAGSSSTAKPPGRSWPWMPRFRLSPPGTCRKGPLGFPASPRMEKPSIFSNRTAYTCWTRSWVPSGDCGTIWRCDPAPSGAWKTAKPCL